LIQVKKLSDPPSPEDGLRVYIERVWPRSVDKDAAKVDEWLKDLAPSDMLRKWYAGDAAKWETFQRRYDKELSGKPKEKQLQLVFRGAATATVTLLYLGDDAQHNNAVALKTFLDSGGGKE